MDVVYTGQGSLIVDRLGQIDPGQMVSLPEELAANLLLRDDFTTPGAPSPAAPVVAAEVAPEPLPRRTPKKKAALIEAPADTGTGALAEAASGDQKPENAPSA